MQPLYEKLAESAVDWYQRRGSCPRYALVGWRTFDHLDKELRPDELVRFPGRMVLATPAGAIEVLIDEEVIDGMRLLPDNACARPRAGP